MQEIYFRNGRRPRMLLRIKWPACLCFSPDRCQATISVMKNAWIALAAVCALVLGVYAYTAHSGYFVSQSLNTADEYYNLLVQGFRAGQLNLKIDVPPGFAQLADPYDPAAHAPYLVLDLSYYKCKFYLYFM